MAEKAYKNRVKEAYETEVVPYLVKKFGYKNINEVPKMVKIVINSGLGDIKDNAKSVQIAHDELKAISGQKPVITKAKKSVANFKVREGMNVGLKVTLRGDRMYEFYDKFVSIALPRMRDFRGVSANSFDGRGNYAMGVKEQLMPVILQFTEEIAADNALTDEAREDFYAMLEGLYYSLELSRAKMVKAVFLGLQAVMRDYRHGAPYIRTIKNVLRQFAII